MELLADVGHVESRFGPFGDSVSVSVRKVHGLCQMYHMLKIVLNAPEIILDTPDQTPGHMESRFSPFGDC